MARKLRALEDLSTGEERVWDLRSRRAKGEERREQGLREWEGKEMSSSPSLEKDLSCSSRKTRFEALRLL